MEEKRKAKRIILDGNLAMNRIDGAKHELVPIQVIDVSKSGIGFECARELEMNSVYELDLTLWTKEVISTFVSVIRADLKGGRRIYGGTFVGLTEADACKIEIYDMFNS